MGEMGAYWEIIIVPLPGQQTHNIGLTSRGTLPVMIIAGHRLHIDIIMQDEGDITAHIILAGNTASCHVITV